MNSQDLAAYINDRTGHKPVDLGLVLGSGLSGLSGAVQGATIIPYSDLDGFPQASVSGHNANLVIGTLEGVNVAVFGGRAHYYEKGQADAMCVPLETLKELGAKTVCLTNSAGSLHKNMPPGSQMLITDHINLSGANPLIGRGGDASFVNMVDAYDLELCAFARAGAKSIDQKLYEGVYSWYSGPSFETPAEIRMAKLLGIDAVGMSTIPEVILARYLGLKVIGFSNITNYGAGMADHGPSHTETKEEAAKAAVHFEALMRSFLRQL
ncbi:MAG: purine-nucleoside phosphorylase [Robiginitomaculum sp.]|nr:purine-nucleoside phosphorylase [Robiginitomaculum sp.]